MNKEDYFKYYIQGSDHYLIPKDVFDELFDEMEYLQQENQSLKKENKILRENAEHNDKVVDKTNWENLKLKKENDEYKRLGFKHLNDKCNKLENQQKEFIKYLEDEIKQINPKILDDGELNLRLDDIKYTQYLTYKEILQKYKSITGVSDENNMEKSK